MTFGSGGQDGTQRVSSTPEECIKVKQKKSVKCEVDVELRRVIYANLQKVCIVDPGTRVAKATLLLAPLIGGETRSNRRTCVSHYIRNRTLPQRSFVEKFGTCLTTTAPCILLVVTVVRSSM